MARTRGFISGYRRRAVPPVVYTFWKRSAPPASMDIFNAPTRENCTVRRERTDTPLQALVTMNDVQFVEAARELAGRAHADRPRLRRAARLSCRRGCWRGLLTLKERSIAKQSYERFRTLLRGA